MYAWILMKACNKYAYFHLKVGVELFIQLWKIALKMPEAIVLKYRNETKVNN